MVRGTEKRGRSWTPKCFMDQQCTGRGKISGLCSRMASRDVKAEGKFEFLRANRVEFRPSKQFVAYQREEMSVQVSP